MSSYLEVWDTQSFCHFRGICFRSNQEKGYFKSHEEANEAYVEQRKLVKQAKATLAKLDEATCKGTGSFKKTSKKHKEAAATASQPYPNLQAQYITDLKKATEAVVLPSCPFVALAGCCLLRCFCCWYFHRASFFWLIVVFTPPSCLLPPPSPVRPFITMCPIANALCPPPHSSCPLFCPFVALASCCLLHSHCC